MKASAEKTTKSSSATAARLAGQPFFSRAGGGEFFAPAVQMKMSVSNPGDKLEQEADSMAAKVMRMPAPATLDREDKPRFQSDEKLQKEPLPEDRICRQEEEEIQKSPASDEKLQRRVGKGAPAVSPALQSAIRSSMSGGQPLQADVRSYMEPRFEADFSNIRVHSDPESAGLSSQLGARAFTYRSHIFFSRGQYQPGTGEGKQLLAHELAHTLQQGAVAHRKAEPSKVQKPAVQRSASDWVRDKIREGLNWAADRLIPGYTLLNVILGKNVLTGEPVSRTGANLIRGFMRLSPVIGSVLLSELEETDSLPEAGVWVEAQVARLGINFGDLAGRLGAMWDEMSVWKGIEYNVEIFRKYLSPVLGRFMAFSGIVMEKVKELRFEAALRLVGATNLLAAVKKDAGAFKRLVDDPKTILRYFMDALKGGLDRFKSNFEAHFKDTLFGWLFGKAAEMGVQVPEQLNVAGLFHLIAQLVGATYQQIRMQVVKKLGQAGESIISRLEKTSGFIKDLAERGPIALWERVQSFLTGLKEMVFGKIAGLVSFEVVKAAVLKLVSMLNPAGAIVQLVLGIYRVVKFFIDRWETIKQITNSILESITHVALGSIGAAATLIESTMAKGVTLMIGFLAGVFGIGGIVDKVKALIKKISDPVQAAIGKAVGWIVDKAKGLVEKLGTGILQTGVPKDPNERLILASKYAIGIARGLGPRVTRRLLEPALRIVKTRYGLASLRVLERDSKWWAELRINPSGEVCLGVASGKILTGGELMTFILADLKQMGANPKNLASLLIQLEARYKPRGLLSLRRFGTVKEGIGVELGSQSTAVIEGYRILQDTPLPDLGSVTAVLYIDGVPLPDARLRNIPHKHAEIVVIQILKRWIKDTRKIPRAVEMLISQSPCPRCTIEIIKLQTHFPDTRFSVYYKALYQSTSGKATESSLASLKEIQGANVNIYLWTAQGKICMPELWPKPKAQTAPNS